jgi:hypothetical protein
MGRREIDTGVVDGGPARTRQHHEFAATRPAPVARRRPPGAYEQSFCAAADVPVDAPSGISYHPSASNRCSL